MLGPPGSGKGTQARRLAARLGLAHLSVGALLRAQIAAGTELGRRVESAVASGALADHRDVVAALREPLAQAEAAGGWILDGAPRSAEQARLLAPVIEDGARPAVVVLDAPDDELRARLLRRGTLEDRSDDEPAVIEHRLALWAAERDELLGYYAQRGLLRVVDGTGDPDEIAARVEHAVHTALAGE